MPERTQVMYTKSAIFLAAVCTLSQPALAAPTYLTVDVPGATGASLVAINDAGVSAGSYENGSGFHSFIRAADGTITTFDPLGSNNDEVRGIDSAGDTIGVFTVGKNVPRCFIRSTAGVFTLFGPPNGGLNACYVLVMNDNGYVAGEGNHGPRHNVGTYAFVRGPRGKVTKFLKAGYEDVGVGGINNAGTIVGTTQSGGQAVGYVRAADGTITTFTGPGGGPTEAFAINDNGTIAGGVGTSPGQLFVLTPDGTYSLFTVPGATTMSASAINANGDVTGSYYTGTSPGSYVRSANGDLTTISVDGGITLASGINAEGVIVGAYVDANGKEHGFIRTP